MIECARDDPRGPGRVWVMELDNAPPVVMPRLTFSFRREVDASATRLAGEMGISSPDEIAGRLAAGRLCYTTRLATLTERFETQAAGPDQTGLSSVPYRQSARPGSGNDSASLDQQPERLTAWGWVSFGEELVGELRLRLQLDPGEAYIWDCATLPDFRNQGLFTALLGYILADLRVSGMRRVWIGADLANRASQRAITRAGFTPVADLVSGRVLALRQVWLLPAPGASVELMEAARRVFLNNRENAWLSALSAVERSL